jgi:hypothetical protein
MKERKYLFIKRATFISGITLIFLLLPSVVNGQGSLPVGETTPPVSELPIFGSDLKSFASGLQGIIIAIGVVSSIFILPYIVVLFNTGNPDQIKKAQGWLYNLIGGILLLVLSTFIIRAIGGSLFGT